MIDGLFQRVRSDEGVSLAELMITLFITAIIAGLMISWVVTVQRTDANEQEIQQALDQMMIAKSQITKEMRYAHGVSTDPLLTGDHQVTLWIDKQGVGTEGSPDVGIGELITWRFNADGTLVRISDDPAEPNRVVAYDLVYADPAVPGTSFFEYPAPERVTINLVADVDPTATPNPQSITTEIFLRNS